MSPEASEAEKTEVSVVVKTIFHHIDGMAIGSSVQSLAMHGVFDRLKKTHSPCNVNHLADEVGARKGYFQVALRLLAHQGFLRLSGEMDNGRKEVTLTDEGIAWLTLVDYYQQIPRLLDRASELPGILSSDDFNIESELFLPQVPNHIETSGIMGRVALHLHGALVAVIMTELYTKGVLEKLISRLGRFLAFDEITPNPTVSEFLANILEIHGWARTQKTGIALTDRGILAAQWTPQYFYPVSYLSTFRNVPELLFGTGHNNETCDTNANEAHIDRNLDIKFSGVVFQRTCRQPFLDIVLPIFNREPLSEQPASIVDTGSGDGTLLMELFQAIKTQTLRGRFLESFPLLLVGAEYTRVAIEATKATLEAAGIPSKTIFGDIGDPSRLSKTLLDIGVDPVNALHVSKSVIHNRTYKNPEQTERLANWKPLSQSPFTLPNGSLIRPRVMECNLIELFEKWAPLTKKHGMVVIEAHTVDPELVSNHVGQNIVTCLDATHGYSNQYLIESEVFERAAKAAGYECLAYRKIGGKLIGRPTMTINHFSPL